MNGSTRSIAMYISHWDTKHSAVNGKSFAGTTKDPAQ